MKWLDGGLVVSLLTLACDGKSLNPADNYGNKYEIGQELLSTAKSYNIYFILPMYNIMMSIVGNKMQDI